MITEKERRDHKQKEGKKDEPKMIQTRVRRTRTRRRGRGRGGGDDQGEMNTRDDRWR